MIETLGRPTVDAPSEPLLPSREQMEPPLAPPPCSSCSLSSRVVPPVLFAGFSSCSFREKKRQDEVAVGEEEVKCMDKWWSDLEVLCDQLKSGSSLPFRKDHQNSHFACRHYFHPQLHHPLEGMMQGHLLTHTAGSTSRGSRPPRYHTYYHIERFTLYLHTLIQPVLCPSLEPFSSCAEKCVPPQSSSSSSLSQVDKQAGGEGKGVEASSLTTPPPPPPPPPFMRSKKSQHVQTLWRRLQEIDLAIESHLQLDYRVRADALPSSSSPSPPPGARDGTTLSMGRRRTSSCSSRSRHRDPNSHNSADSRREEEKMKIEKVEEEKKKRSTDDEHCNVFLALLANIFSREKEEQEGDEGERMRKKIATAATTASKREENREEARSVTREVPTFMFRDWRRYPHLAAWVEETLVGKKSTKSFFSSSTSSCSSPPPQERKKNIRKKNTKEEEEEEDEEEGLAGRHRSVRRVLALYMANLLFNARCGSSSSPPSSSSSEIATIAERAASAGEVAAVHINGVVGDAQEKEKETIMAEEKNGNGFIWSDVEVLRLLMLLAPLAQDYFFSMVGGGDGCRRSTAVIPSSFFSSPPSSSSSFTSVSSPSPPPFQEEEKAQEEEAQAEAAQRKKALEGVLRLLLQYFDPELILQLESYHHVDVSEVLVDWLQGGLLPSFSTMKKMMMIPTPPTTTTSTSTASASSSSSSPLALSKRWWEMGLDQLMDFIFFGLLSPSQRYLLPYTSLSILISFRNLLLDRTITTTTPPPLSPSTKQGLSSPLLPFSCTLPLLPLAYLANERKQQQEEEFEACHGANHHHLFPSSLNGVEEEEEEEEEGRRRRKAEGVEAPAARVNPLSSTTWNYFFSELGRQQCRGVTTQSFASSSSSSSLQEKPRQPPPSRHPQKDGEEQQQPQIPKEEKGEEEEDHFQGNRLPRLMYLCSGLEEVGSIPLLPLPFMPERSLLSPSAALDQSSPASSSQLEAEDEKEDEDEEEKRKRKREKENKLLSSSVLERDEYGGHTRDGFSSCFCAFCPFFVVGTSRAGQVWWRNAEFLYRATPLATQRALQFLFPSSPSSLNDTGGKTNGGAGGELGEDDACLDTAGSGNLGGAREGSVRGTPLLHRYENPIRRRQYRHVGFLAAYYAALPVLPIEDIDILSGCFAGDFPPCPETTSFSSSSSRSITHHNVEGGGGEGRAKVEDERWRKENAEEEGEAVKREVVVASREHPLAPSSLFSLTPPWSKLGVSLFSTSSSPSSISSSSCTRRPFCILDCRRRKSVEFGRLPHSLFIGDMAAASGLEEMATTRLLLSLASYRGEHLVLLGTGRGCAVTTGEGGEAEEGRWNYTGTCNSSASFSSSPPYLSKQANRILEEDENHLLLALALALVRRGQLPLVGWCVAGMEGLRRLVYHRKIVLERGPVTLPDLPGRANRGNGVAAGPAAAVGITRNHNPPHNINKQTTTTTRRLEPAGAGPRTGFNSSPGAVSTSENEKRSMAATGAAGVGLMESLSSFFGFGSFTDGGATTTTEMNAKVNSSGKLRPPSAYSSSSSSAVVAVGSPLSSSSFPSRRANTTNTSTTAEVPPLSAHSAMLSTFLGPEGFVPFFPEDFTTTASPTPPGSTKPRTTSTSGPRSGGEGPPPASASPSPLNPALPPFFPPSSSPPGNAMDAVSIITKRITATAQEWWGNSERGTEVVGPLGRGMLDKRKEAAVTAGTAVEAAGRIPFPRTSPSLSSSPLPRPSSSSWRDIATRVIRGVGGGGGDNNNNNNRNNNNNSMDDSHRRHKEEEGGDGSARAGKEKKDEREEKKTASSEAPAPRQQGGKAEAAAAAADDEAAFMGFFSSAGEEERQNALGNAQSSEFYPVPPPFFIVPNHAERERGEEEVVHPRVASTLRPITSSSSSSCLPQTTRITTTTTTANNHPNASSTRYFSTPSNPLGEDDLPNRPAEKGVAADGAEEGEEEEEANKTKKRGKVEKEEERSERRKTSEVDSMGVRRGVEVGIEGGTFPTTTRRKEAKEELSSHISSLGMWNEEGIRRQGGEEGHAAGTSSSSQDIDQLFDELFGE